MNSIFPTNPLQTKKDIQLHNYRDMGLLFLAAILAAVMNQFRILQPRQYANTVSYCPDQVGTTS